MQQDLMSIRDWAKTVDLNLTRSVAGELGQLATSLADQARQPLKIERDSDGSRRNQYPENLITDAWKAYTLQNPLCPEISVRLLF